MGDNKDKDNNNETKRSEMLLQALNVLFATGIEKIKLEGEIEKKENSRPRTRRRFEERRGIIKGMNTNKAQLIKTVRKFFGAEVNFTVSDQGNRQIEVINPYNGGAWITVEKANWDYERLSAFMLKEVWKQIERQLLTARQEF